MSTTTADRVAALIDDLFGVPAHAVTPDMTMQDGLQLDSLSLVELQVAIGDVFDIHFQAAGTIDVFTVGQLVDAIDSALVRSRRQAS